MKDTKRGSYKSHRLNNDLKSLVGIQIDRSNMDRYYMDQQLKPNIEYLLQNGISHYQDFSHLFKKYKMKKGDIVNFIKAFEYFINSKTNEKKIFWLRTRELKKSNFCEKNIIINRLFLEYNSYVLYFFSYYFSFIQQSMINYEGFYHEFENEFKELLKQRKINQFETQTFDKKNISNLNTNPELSFSDLLKGSTNVIYKDDNMKNSNFIISSNYVKKITIFK